MSCLLVEKTHPGFRVVKSLAKLGYNSREIEFLRREPWWNLAMLYFKPYVEHFTNEYDPFHAGLNDLEEVRGLVLTSPYLRFALPVPAWKLSAGRLIGYALPWFPMRTEIRAEMLTSDASMLALARSDPLRLQIVTPGWFFAAQEAQAVALARGPDLRLPALVTVSSVDAMIEPIVRLLRDPEARRRLESPDRGQLAQFHWEHAARLQATLYREMIG